MVLVFSKDAKLFLLEHKALVWQRSVCLRVLWCRMKAGWAHRAWAVSVLSGHESSSTFSFTAVGCFIPLYQSWGGTLLPVELAYKDFWGMLVSKLRKKKWCLENILETLLQKLFLKCLGRQAGRWDTTRMLCVCGRKEVPCWTLSWRVVAWYSSGYRIDLRHFCTPAADCILLHDKHNYTVSFV